MTPRLFFTVLLRRAARDLAREVFTVELRQRQKVFLFDSDKVIELLEDERLRDYLASMLASFTRIQSLTVRVRARPGVWRRYRTSDLDVEGLMRYCQALESELRYGCYRRIGDVCLFLAGLFPEHIESQRRYPLSGQLRPAARSRLLTRLEDYESYGQSFYRLAGEHEAARLEGLEETLGRLSADFVLAEKALRFVGNRYLQLARHSLFAV